MTYYDAQPDDEQPITSMQDAPLSESDTPEPDAPPVETTPDPEPAAPPAPDLSQTVAQLAQTFQADMQRRQQEAQQAQLAEQQRQWEASRPRALMEQDEWRQRYEDALERSGYDPDARRAVAGMNQELAREQAIQMMGGMREELRLEMQADNFMAQAARSSLTPYGGMATEADFQTVALETFGGNRAALAQALSPQNPNAAQVGQMLARAAVGYAIEQGRVQPGRANPAPPANPRSAARPAPATAPVNEVTDPNVVLAALWD